MRILLSLLLFTLLSCTSKSQSVTAQYLYWSGGSYWFSIQNTRTCDASVRISYSKGGLPKDTVVMVSAVTTFVLQVPALFGSITDVKLKADGQCSTTGWQIVSLGTQTLPLSIKAFSASRSPEGVKLYYQLIWDTSPTDVVELQRSSDSRTWSTIHVISFGEHYYTDKASGFQYYRIRISDGLNAKLSNILVVGPGNEIPTTVSLFTLDGNFIRHMMPHEKFPKGVYLVRQGGKYRIQSVTQF